MNINQFDAVMNNTVTIEEETMFNEESLFDDAVVPEVNVTTEKQMRKIGELRLAEAAVPSIFIDMYLNKYMEDQSDNIKMIIAGAIFRTCYRLEDRTMCKEEFKAELSDHIDAVSWLNNDKGTKLKGANVDLDMTVAFMEKSKLVEELCGIYYVTQKFWDKTFSEGSAAPMLVGEKRRVPYVKGNDSKPSSLMQEAMDFLADTQFTVDARMLAVINAVHLKLKQEKKSLKVFSNSGCTLNGSAAMDSNIAYITEIDADNRGRLYNVAHYGPNAQKDDMNRALVRLVVPSLVKHNSDEFKFMMNEYLDLTGGLESLQSDKALIAMLESPSACLYTLLTKYDTKSAFSIVRLGSELANVIVNGEADMYFPAGLDAKCSGTQIYSILVGDMKLMKATGFQKFDPATNVDPYKMTALKFGGLVTRNAIKSPYMMVQYGGGLKAVTACSDYMDVTPTGWTRLDFAKATIKAVEDTMGDKIMRLRAVLQTAVKAKCDAMNVEYFKYTHIDGFVVNKEVNGSVDITEHYATLRYQAGGVISFGSREKSQGLVGIDDRTPDREEFARTFAVNYIQGLDALIARTVAVLAKEAGIEGFISIHDCFRSAPKDVMKLKDIIRKAYITIFIENDPLTHLFNQLGLNKEDEGFETLLTEEMVNQEDNYFFAQ